MTKLSKLGISIRQRLTRAKKTATVIAVMLVAVFSLVVVLAAYGGDDRLSTDEAYAVSCSELEDEVMKDDVATALVDEVAEPWNTGGDDQIKEIRDHLSIACTEGSDSPGRDAVEAAEGVSIE